MPNKLSSQVINDPTLYRKMSEPFPDTETANDAVKDFCGALRELRGKHKIPDVLFTLRVNCIVKGEELVAIVPCFCGDANNEETMAAYSLAEAQANRQARTALALKGCMEKP